MFGGLEGTLAQLAKATAELTEQAQEQAENLQKSKDDATKAADELKIALKQQIDQGQLQLNRTKIKYCYWVQEEPCVDQLI